MKVNQKEIIGFEWDAGNTLKSWQKHRVAMFESEETFFNHPLMITDDKKHSNQEPRFHALGHTNGGRLLFISFTVRNRRIRVISARDMNKKERSLYLI
jgi:uncharacterized protein